MSLFSAVPAIFNGHETRNKARASLFNSAADLSPQPSQRACSEGSFLWFVCERELTAPPADTPNNSVTLFSWFTKSLQQHFSPQINPFYYNIDIIPEIIL